MGLLVMAGASTVIATLAALQFIGSLAASVIATAGFFTGVRIVNVFFGEGDEEVGMEFLVGGFCLSCFWFGAWLVFNGNPMASYCILTFPTAIGAVFALRRSSL